MSSDFDENYVLTQAYENPQLYNQHNLPRTNSRGGGLTVIYKRKIELTLVSHKSTSDFEAAFFNFPKKVITLCLLYRPPSGSTKVFLEFLYNNIQPLSIESDLFSIGDFNMPQSAALNSFFQETSLTQLVKKSTHRAGNILDLLVTNEPYLFSEIEQQRLDYSDDDQFKFCFFHEVVSSNSVKQTVFRAWKKADINKLENDVELTLDLNGHLTCVDTAAELLVDAMDLAAKEAIPIERRSSKLAIGPFFDRELQDLKTDRRKLEKSIRKIQTTKVKSFWRQSGDVQTKEN